MEKYGLNTHKQRKIAGWIKPACGADTVKCYGDPPRVSFDGLSLLLYLCCCVGIVFVFTVVAAKELRADTITAIPDSPYSCQETESGNLLLKDKDNELIPVSFGKVKKKLKKKIKKFMKKEKKLYKKRKGLPYPEYYRVSAEMALAGREKSKNKKILTAVCGCEDGTFEVDDLADPGFSVEKTSWETGKKVGFQPGEDIDETADEAFAYDTDNYFVQSETLHGTTVTVAIHNSAAYQDEMYFDPEDFANVIIDIFHEIWHVYEDFPLDGYVFKVRAKGEASGFALSQGGVVLSEEDYPSFLQTHEIFHSWNGKTFDYIPDGTGNLFQLETFYKEECTVYKSNVINGLATSRYEYKDIMEGLWDQYLEREGTEYDLPYPELAELASAFGTESSEYRTMMSARGNAFAYLLDRELIEAGSCLDEVLRHLYIYYGLEDKQYTHNEVLDIIEELTGQSFADIFDTYLYSNASLQNELDGSFPLLKQPFAGCTD